MAKISCIYLVIFIVFLSTCIFSQNTLRDSVQNTYIGQIGVREATGHNDGTAIEMYLASAGFGKGYAWCAAFVNWTLLQNNIKTVNSPAWSPSWFSSDNIIYQPNDRILKKFPEKGDVFGIWYSSKNRIAHVGFVDNWTFGDYVITVEGNTNKEGSREGDGVYRKKRIKRQIYSVASYIK